MIIFIKNSLLRYSDTQFQKNGIEFREFHFNSQVYITVSNYKLITFQN